MYMWFIINKYVLYAGIMHMYIHSHSLCLLTKSFFRSDRMCSLCERQKLFHWNLWGYALGGRRQVQAFQCCSVKYALSTHARLKIVKNSNPVTTCFKALFCYVSGLGSVEHSKHCFDIGFRKKRALYNAKQKSFELADGTQEGEKWTDHAFGFFNSFQFCQEECLRIVGAMIN